MFISLRSASLARRGSFFYPDISNLPDNICCSNGRYFIGDKKGKSVVVSGNFKFILLRFGDRLRGPLMKLVATIKIYAASEQEVDQRRQDAGEGGDEIPGAVREGG